MAELQLSEKTFEYLQALKDNNEKAWYEEHKPAFETHVRKPFVQLLEIISTVLAAEGMPLYGGKKTMFRQHRDTRFSKDKTPYKTNVGGLLTFSGKKDLSEGLIYLELNTDGGFVAGGWHNLAPGDLKPFRDKIIDQPRGFADILADLKAADLELMDTTYKLKSMPRGYKEYADHEHAKYLKLKSFAATRNLTREDWLAGDLIGIVVRHALACRSMLDFFRSE
jgi:uncharacterized protein (TIGR02453 family)